MVVQKNTSTRIADMSELLPPSGNQDSPAPSAPPVDLSPSPPSQPAGVRLWHARWKQHHFFLWGIGAAVVLAISAIAALSLQDTASVTRNGLAPSGTDGMHAVDRTPSSTKAKEMVARVRTHISLPEGFEPTVAEIIDVEMLRGKNDFYAQAANGDFLIITPSLAILYRPSEDIILNVVPVTLEKPTVTGTSLP